MATGECNCGAVQFEIDAQLSGVFVCHCSICRRSTGSNGIAGGCRSERPIPVGPGPRAHRNVEEAGHRLANLVLQCLRLTRAR